jgi:hypothetical protein
MPDSNTSTTSKHNFQFLSGGGEMGALTREKNWASTAVGDPANWPQSLRTTLGILLHSKFPMFLWWGPELICFYNDAYRPSLGENGKHPGILGTPAKQAWPEIWHIIYPLIEQVLNGGESTWSEDQLIPIFRNGRLEDVYWTFSYSPVNDESGSVTGVLVTCTETTDQVLTRKNLEESKEQLEFAIDAARLGTWDYNPASNRFTANNRLKQWFGLLPEAEIELSQALNAIDVSDRDVVMNAIQKALDPTGGGLYDIEYGIVNPVTGKKAIVHARGRAWFTEDKIAYRFNGTLEDVTEKVLARNKIEQSEQRFRNMIQQAPMAIAILNGPQFIVEAANENYLQLVSRQGNDFIGQKLFDVLPEVKAAVEPLLTNVQETGTPYYGYEFPVPIIRGNKEELNHFNFVYHPIKEEDGSFSRIAVVAMDVTPSVKTKQTLAESEQRLRSFVDSAPFPIGVYIGREMRIQLVNQSILDVWGKGQDVIGKLYAEVLPELAGQGIYEQLDNVFTTGIAFHAHYQRVDLIIDNALQSHYFNYSFTPLFDVNGQVYGVMNTAAEVTDMVLAKQKVEESEKEFRQLADSLPELVWTTDSMGRQTFASRRWKEFTGLDPYDEATFEKIVHPDDLENILQNWQECLASGNIYKANARLKNTNGEYQWFYVHGEPIKNEKGEIEKWVGAFTNLNVQKKAEQELVDALSQLEESETRFRYVANSAPVFIWMAGTDMQRNFFNTAWLNFTGRTLEQEKGYGWTEVVHPDDLEKCLHIYTDAFNHRQEYSMEYRLKRHDGEYRWISARGVPQFTSQNIFEGYIGACMDIHERVIYHKKLKEDEERLNIIINASELGTWELNLENHEFHYSKKFLQTFGHSTEKLIQYDELLNYFDDGDLLVRKRAFKEAYETGILHYIARITWDDKSVHWIENRGKVFYNENNQPQKMIGTTRDITEEKNYQQKLEEREQKFRLLADSMPQFVWTGNAEGTLNYFSKAVYDYTGLSEEQLQAKGWLQIVHPDDREENMNAWMHSINTGTDFIFEHRFQRNDGEYRWQLSRAIPQRDAAGNIQRWVGTSTDIQDIKEQEQQKDFFISMASHELKTPITSIKGYVQLLQMTYESGADTFLKNSLKVIDKQIISLTTLISDLLDVSKIKSGSLVLNKQHFQVTEMIQEVINQIQHIHPDYEIQFTNIVPADLYADKERMSQVLINFLTNAVKYSPNAKRITVTNAIEGSNLLVAVQDSGIGISKADQEKIFERFYRVEGKNEKTFPGFGIGLFIASEIVRRHHGKIGVRSEPGKGSEFYFTVPIEKIAAHS